MYKKPTVLEEKTDQTEGLPLCGNRGFEAASEIQSLLIKQHQETKWWFLSFILSLNVIGDMEELHPDPFST